MLLEGGVLLGTVGTCLISDDDDGGRARVSEAGVVETIVVEPARHPVAQGPPGGPGVARLPKMACNFV